LPSSGTAAEVVDDSDADEVTTVDAPEELAGVVVDEALSSLHAASTIAPATARLHHPRTFISLR